MKKYYMTLAAVLVTANVSAAITEQTWGDWFGNTGGMEFALNSMNKAGEQLTLSCSNHQMIVTYQQLKDNYSATSVEGMRDVYLLINGKKYDLDNDLPLKGEVIPAQVAFEALKQTGPKDNIAFTALQSGESKPFSARGLRQALKTVSWQDCMDQP
ncbi:MULTISPECIES: hypothetical protein [unclassified Serratia (in: enterobacteria)]|jgi:hypothetical protein|uniref:hypothetical protein n=1 Tax=unclassified Serratia (in: enterobacteria) TaxID=2647522 RepID=UPI00307632D6